jgi:hypothetical protein
MTRHTSSRPVVEYKRHRGVHVSGGAMTRTYRMSRDEDLDDVLDRVFGKNAVIATDAGDAIGYIVKPDGGWCRVRLAS